MDMLEKLNKIVLDRKLNYSEGSYTSKLLSAGDNTIIKKLGEENAELIRAILIETKESVVSEAADYIYHLTVALRYRDINLTDVLDELEKRYDSNK